MYCYVYRGYKNESFTCIHPWIKLVLKYCGLSYIYEKNQTTCSYNWLTLIVNEILQNQFEQELRNLVDNSSKCINYKIFKTNFNLEKYWNRSTDHVYKITLRFPIETGRWQHIEKK